MCAIYNTIISFFNYGRNSNHNRFKSWEDCFLHFKTKIANNNFEVLTIDALHLGFYLASWGMYRGSSFLLQNSSEIHKPILQEILNPQYSQLWAPNFYEITENWLNLLFSLKTAVINKYREETSASQKVSDTLITKIFLGIIGITPAYDRFFKEGCKQKSITPYSNFSIKSYKRMIQFYLDNIDSFNQAKDTIEQNTIIEYPPMKLVDMFFWSVGSNYNFNQIE